MALIRRAIPVNRDPEEDLTKRTNGLSNPGAYLEVGSPGAREWSRPKVSLGLAWACTTTARDRPEDPLLGSPGTIWSPATRLYSVGAVIAIALA